MDIKQVHATYQSVLRFLLLGRLKQAFDKIQTLNNDLQNWTLHEQLDSLQENYRYMLRYYIDGIEDPERLTIYNKLIARLFVLTEEIKENLCVQNSTEFEYTRKRYFPHTRKHADAFKLLQSLQESHAQLEVLPAGSEQHQAEMMRVRTNYESLLPELFGIFWLTTRLRQDDKTLFQQVMDRTYTNGVLEKSLIVSGLTLNLWRMFDEEKLMLLCDCSESDDPQIKQRALVGLCFILTKYNRFLSYFPSVRNRLVLLADNEHTLGNFRNIIMQIIGTTETEKISKKLQEEILPGIAKISPKLKNQNDVDNLLNSDDWEETNPQWQDMLEDSDVGNKLKELTELQMEGADVYMGTFSMLKTFPFFNETSNWFLPFSPMHTSVYELFKDSDTNILNTFVSSQVMCNSDLYSFSLSVLQMPASQRNLLKQSFKMESEQIDEMKKEEAMLTPEISSKNISKQYIQDLFRFFKLYPQRKDFTDMFESSLLIHKTYLFDILSTDSRFKADIAEYYFSKKLYTQALELFSELLAEREPTAALYQKMGYSFQKTSQFAMALNAYLKADMLQPDDLWTVKKIALCYRLMNEYEKALEYYRHADFLNPEELSTQMHIANCYLQTGKAKEALNRYFELDAKYEDNVKIQRAISWTAFVSGNLKQADYYIQKVLEAPKPTAHDYLNAGHIAWCSQARKAAVDYYRKSLELQQNNQEVFIEALHEDADHLKSYKISVNEIPLMIDEVLYE